MYTLPETNPASLHPKIDGWNTRPFPFRFRPLFRGKLAVSFREGKSQSSGVGPSILSLLSDRSIWSPQLHWIFFIANSQKTTLDSQNQLRFLNALSFWLGAMITEFSRMRQISMKSRPGRWQLMLQRFFRVGEFMVKFEWWKWWLANCTTNHRM